MERGEGRGVHRAFAVLFVSPFHRETSFALPQIRPTARLVQWQSYTRSFVRPCSAPSAYFEVLAAASCYYFYPIFS
jgi:hypothetical protein